MKYVRDVGWSGQAGTLVGPDDKPVLRNVDLSCRRSSEHLLCSFMLQYPHTQVVFWVQLSWAQGKEALPVSNLITLILSRNNLDNLLRNHKSYISLHYLFLLFYYTLPLPHIAIYFCSKHICLSNLCLEAVVLS